MLKLFNSKSSALPRVDHKALGRRLDHICDEFGRTALGRRVMDWLEEQKIEIIFDLGLPHYMRGCVEYPYNRIHLNPDCKDSELICVLAHEARHIWQAHAISEVEHSKTIKLDEYFSSNPFAAYIFTRFIEADAFSFDHCFMLGHMQETGIGRDVYVSDTSYAVIKKIGRNLKTHDMTEHRRAAFEAFFTDGAEILHYDRTNRASLFAEFWIGLTMAGYRFSKEHNEAKTLKESHLIALGGTAWGEVPKDNYLTNSKGGFDMKDDYTGHFMTKDRRLLKRLGFSPLHIGMNRYTTEDGKKHRLISL